MLPVRLLGQFDTRADGKHITLPSRAAQSLFAFLILTGGIAGKTRGAVPASNARRKRAATSAANCVASARYSLTALVE